MEFLFFCHRAVAGKSLTKIPVAVTMNLDAVLSALAKDDMTKGFSGRELPKIVMAVNTKVNLIIHSSNPLIHVYGHRQCYFCI